ncbi:unnamed protein product [Nippostrongylus brasiliensis]|uniref:Transposase n=1 Tax=Nippostrongylus brasiliensis TaxID=27835 RepID=A0A0N4Y459_NIPBR|nr:unnamed protein product [Nippostrongylus brasiliensis]
MYAKGNEHRVGAAALDKMEQLDPDEEHERKHILRGEKNRLEPKRRDDEEPVLGQVVQLKNLRIYFENSLIY